MYKLMYLVIFAALAVLDWRTVRGRTNAFLYFGLFLAAAVLAVLSVWLLKDFSLGRLFS